VSGTQLYYGNVLLDGVTTESFEQTPRRDESNTDQLFHEFTIAVSTVIQASNFGKTIGATGTAGSTAQAVLIAIQTTLSLDRQPFRFVMDGTTLLEASAPDLGNGPMVQYWSAVPVGQTIHVRFAVKVCVLRCLVGFQDPITGIPGLAGLPVPAVLYHRWNYEEQVDERYTRRRVWNGTFRTRSIDIAPHLLRNQVTPPLARGFKRQHMNFNQSRDGLTCDYQIIDVAIERPPSPRSIGTSLTACRPASTG
jgi:hypothetical protein